MQLGNMVKQKALYTFRSLNMAFSDNAKVTFAPPQKKIGVSSSLPHLSANTSRRKKHHAIV
jgi:hypothetical protein